MIPIADWRAEARAMQAAGRRVVTIARRLEQPRRAVSEALGIAAPASKIRACGCVRVPVVRFLERTAGDAGGL